ncbi:MAG: hypothetical protein Q8O14_02105 [bacterium]|jgi:hypothetical protein|nr:hypothetical protein [bacterium]
MKRVTLVLALATTAAAQLTVLPCRLALDSVVVQDRELEFGFVFHRLECEAPWSAPLNRLVVEEARRRAGEAIQEAEDLARDDEMAGEDLDADEALSGPASFQWARLTVEWATPELVSLREHVSEYWSGAAHGSEQTRFRILAWAEGELQPVSLGGLLTWNGALEAELNRQLVGRLRLQGASAVLAGDWPGFGTLRLQDAAPVADGLRYVVNEYEAASYSEGAFDILIPWRVLVEWIPADGVLDRMRREE